jgi:hypothetical protein
MNCFFVLLLLGVDWQIHTVLPGGFANPPGAGKR